MQGLQGLKGDKGDVGPQGPKGDKGDKGKDGALVTVGSAQCNSGNNGRIILLGTDTLQPYFQGCMCNARNQCQWIRFTTQQ